MAEKVIFCIFFSFFIAFVHSRNLPHTTTTVLDVESLVQKTVHIISSNRASMAPLNQQEDTIRAANSLSFQLHSRATVHRGTHRDYKALTMERMDRDEARFRSIQTRLDLAIMGVTHRDLKPVEVDLQVEDFEGPVISGTSQGSGEYFSRVGIGRPASQVYMVLDTGSDVNWVQCAPCAECYTQADPIFEPASSTTFNPLTCNTQQCKSLDVFQCRNDSCLYEVSYGDGSYTVGDFVTETITFGGSASVENIAIGCGHNNEGLFIGAAGLIGLGGGPLSFPSQINASSFSYCLVDRDSDSASTLEFDSKAPANSVTAPLLTNSKLSTFYYVDLTGIGVGGDLLSIPKEVFKISDDGEGGIIVDSGTAVTRLPTAAYNVLRDEFVKRTKALPQATAVALFDTCYDLSSRKSVEVPTVTFHFSNGKSLSLPAKNYLIPVDGTGTFCFAFAPSTSPLGIIGNVQQQGTRVSYDLVNSLIGFSPNNC